MAALTDKLAKPAIRIESLFFIVYFLSLSNQSEDLVRSLFIVDETFISSMKGMVLFSSFGSKINLILMKISIALLFINIVN
ncbi:hypothetical protein EEJ33_16170 [Vibrio cholerae]|nr:hypothetical protein EEJ33_16170 [Vibrio cholerae]